MAKTLKEKVLEVLKDHGSLSRVSLRHLVGIDERSDRQMRLAIEELRDEGHAIGSSPKRGYFMIETEEDWNEATREFMTRAKSCLRHYGQLKTIGEKRFSRQLELQMEDTGNELECMEHMVGT